MTRQLERGDTSGGVSGVSEIRIHGGIGVQALGEVANALDWKVWK